MQEWRLPSGPRGAVELVVCRWGERRPGQRPLVVLHGFLEQGAAWQDVALHLGREVHAPDQRGFGRSGHVGEGGWYHFWDYAGDLDRLVDHLGAPIDLVGHSMGGTVACQYAGLRPDRVRRLVLVEGLGPPDGFASMLRNARSYLDARREAPIHHALADVHDAAARIRRWHPQIAEETALCLATRISRPARPGERLRGEVGPGTLTWTWDPVHRARSPQPFRQDQFAVLLGAIEAPTLVVDGGDSTFRFPGLEERATAVRDARFATVPGAGHMVHLDAPAALAALVTAHLES